MSSYGKNYLIKTFLRRSPSRDNYLFAKFAYIVCIIVSSFTDRMATSSHILSSPRPSRNSGRVIKRGKGKGHPLPSKAKHIIEAVRQFFEKERLYQRSELRNQVVKRTAKACGVSTATVTRIHDEFVDTSGLLSTPEKRYASGTRVQVRLDEHDVAAIRKEVHGFYERKEYPTLDKLLGVVKAKKVFDGSRTTLWKVLQEMGFRHKKHENKQYIYEQPRIIQQRHDYLR